jgi:hypothetical protein
MRPMFSTTYYIYVHGLSWGGLSSICKSPSCFQELALGNPGHVYIRRLPVPIQTRSTVARVVYASYERTARGCGERVGELGFFKGSPGGQVAFEALHVRAGWDLLMGGSTMGFPAPYLYPDVKCTYTYKTRSTPIRPRSGS